MPANAGMFLVSEEDQLLPATGLVLISSTRSFLFRLAAFFFATFFLAFFLFLEPLGRPRPLLAAAFFFALRLVAFFFTLRLATGALRLVTFHFLAALRFEVFLRDFFLVAISVFRVG